MLFPWQERAKSQTSLYQQKFVLDILKETGRGVLNQATAYGLNVKFTTDGGQLFGDLRKFRNLVRIYPLLDLGSLMQYVMCARLWRLPGSLIRMPLIVSCATLSVPLVMSFFVILMVILWLYTCKMVGSLLINNWLLYICWWYSVTQKTRCIKLLPDGVSKLSIELWLIRHIS